MCCRVNWEKQGFRFSRSFYAPENASRHVSASMFTVCLAIMDADKVVLVCANAFGLFTIENTTDIVIQLRCLSTTNLAPL